MWASSPTDVGIEPYGLGIEPYGFAVTVIF